MKTLIAIFITGMAVVAVNPAFAGRDETQWSQLRQAMEAKKADQLAQATRTQAGVAGATGLPGKAGPGTQAPRRDPASNHP